MKRLLAAALLTAGVFAPVARAANPLGPLGTPGGACDGAVDVMCNTHVCQPDELDCGMVPPCVLWLVNHCEID